MQKFQAINEESCQNWVSESLPKILSQNLDWKNGFGVNSYDVVGRHPRKMEDITISFIIWGRKNKIKKIMKISRNFHCTNELKIVKKKICRFFKFPHMLRTQKSSSFFQSPCHETLSCLVKYRKSRNTIPISFLIIIQMSLKWINVTW